MEKWSATLMLFMAFCTITFSQQKVYVYQTSGAFLKQNEKQTRIQKGDLIRQGDKVFVSQTTNTTFLDQEGNLYTLNVVGDYHFKDILQHKVKASKEGLTKKYFKYLWDKMTKENIAETKIGGVFRGDILMTTPKDSVLTASSKITFSWETNEQATTYYLILKNTETEALFKVATNGSQLTLYKNDAFFSDGKYFEWAVSTAEFPNIKNLHFYHFELISKSVYVEMVAKYVNVVTALEQDGYNSTEIETIICETYGLCK